MIDWLEKYFDFAEKGVAFVSYWTILLLVCTMGLFVVIGTVIASFPFWLMGKLSIIPLREKKMNIKIISLAFITLFLGVAYAWAMAGNMSLLGSTFIGGLAMFTLSLTYKEERKRRRKKK